MLATLREFAAVAEDRSDTARAAWCREQAEIAARSTGGTCVGRPMVSPGLLRRRDAPRFGDQRRMPDRLDCPIVGGDLRRREPGARSPVHGGGATATGPRDRSAHPAVRSAIRQGNLGARLYQGIRAGHSRERRAIHARCYLGGAGNRSPGARRAGDGTLRAAESDPPFRFPEKVGSLQGGAVRRGGRRLWSAAAHWSWRLDLVHGFGGLVVPDWSGSDPRFSSARKPVCRSSPAFLRTGPATRSPTATAQPLTT